MYWNEGVIYGREREVLLGWAVGRDGRNQAMPGERASGSQGGQQCRVGSPFLFVLPLALHD